MLTPQEFHTICTKEFATTVKVLRAMPADQLTFSPHERSSDARKLISTFVFEMYLLNAHMFGSELSADQFSGYRPESLDIVIADFEKESQAFLDSLHDADQEIMSKAVSFAGNEFTGMAFMRMMLFDQIHHRGQLSVYVRLAGGKVPSIYGPSADDESTNL